MEWKLVKNRQFVSVAGLKQVYEPVHEGSDTASKYPCKDCHFCQHCSDARCHACRDSKRSGGRGCGPKLSIREQIAVYEEINRHGHDPRACSE
jgi:hypothetical protein